MFAVTQHISRTIFLMALAAAAAGCASTPTDLFSDVSDCSSNTKTSACGSGFECVDRACVPSAREAGAGRAGIDAGVDVPCGDGKLETGEDCDDGNMTSGDGCSDSCHSEPGWVCDQSQPTQCSAKCGDGVLVGAEALAGGCDDGNLTALDGCSSTCQVESGYACSGTPSVCAKTCGNGRLDAGEGCDDGNAKSGDGCASCAVEVGF